MSKIYYSIIKENSVTDKDLDKRYYDNKTTLSKKAQFINWLKNDFNYITMNYFATKEQIKNSIDKLKRIALNSNSFELSE